MLLPEERGIVGCWAERSTSCASLPSVEPEWSGKTQVMSPQLYPHHRMLQEQHHLLGSSMLGAVLGMGRNLMSSVHSSPRFRGEVPPLPKSTQPQVIRPCL